MKAYTSEEMEEIKQSIISLTDITLTFLLEKQIENKYTDAIMYCSLQYLIMRVEDTLIKLYGAEVVKKIKESVAFKVDKDTSKKTEFLN